MGSTTWSIGFYGIAMFLVTVNAKTCATDPWQQYQLGHVDLNKLYLFPPFSFQERGFHHENFRKETGMYSEKTERDYRKGTARLAYHSKDISCKKSSCS